MAVVTRVLDRLWARVPPRVQEGVFEALLRTTMISAAREVRPAARFAFNELFLVHGTRRYRLRGSGRTLFVRHPVADAWVVHEVINQGVYAPPAPVQQVLRRLEAPRIVDLGAHIGAATLLLLDHFPSARVVAVEPHPESATLLRSMIAANRLDDRCEVRQVAAGVSPGHASMEGFSVLAHLVRTDTEEAVDLLPALRKYQGNGSGAADVEVVDVLPLLAEADLVKMDIEGAEWPILTDPRFAQLAISALVLEYHPQGAPQADTTEAVSAVLRDAGFTVGEPFEQHGGVGLLWAWRETAAAEASVHPNHDSAGLTPQDDRVPYARPLVRLYASKHTHRLLPAPVALAIVGALGPPSRRHRNRAERGDAERFMADLLLYTPRAGEAHVLARRFIREKSRIRELFWRPWLLKRSRVTGAEHWDAARDGGRGCVIVFGHMGGTYAVPPILAQHGFDFHMVTSPHYWEPLPPGFVGLALQHLRREYGEKPLGWSRLIPSNAGPERLIELLAGGASIAIAFDVPGSAATPFLGRSVALGGGPATLAFQTGAKVLPVLPERHGSRIDLRILEPLDPADFRDARSLRAAIARTFEEFVLARPEIVELAWYPSPLVTEAIVSQAPSAAWDAL